MVNEKFLAILKRRTEAEVYPAEQKEAEPVVTKVKEKIKQIHFLADKKFQEQITALRKEFRRYNQEVNTTWIIKKAVDKLYMQEIKKDETS